VNAASDAMGFTRRADRHAFHSMSWVTRIGPPQRNRYQVGARPRRGRAQPQAEKIAREGQSGVSHGSIGSGDMRLCRLIETSRRRPRPSCRSKTGTSSVPR